VDGIDATFESMDRACTADPACPLHPSGGLSASYDELARRLESGEVRAPGVGPTQLVYAAFFATYDAGTWPRLWTAVARGLSGDLGGIAELAADYTGLVPYTPFAIVSCLDSEHAVGHSAWQRSAEPVVQRSARFGATLANELLPCAFWPQGTYEPRDLEARGTPPILVIGSTGDAATPYDSAVAVAEDLDGGVLLTVEIDGHVAIGDSACATERATRYLVDLTVPERGARC
jgi:pimeloyl-ACP methyl ester carboxylesterase